MTKYVVLTICGRLALIRNKNKLADISSKLKNDINTEHDVEYAVKILKDLYLEYKDCLHYAFTYSEIDKMEELLLSENIYGCTDSFIDYFVKDGDVFIIKIFSIMSGIQNILTFDIHYLLNIKNIAKKDQDCDYLNSAFEYKRNYLSEINKICEDMQVLSSIIKNRIIKHNRCKRIGKEEKKKIYIYNEIKNIIIKMSKSSYKEENKSTISFSDKIWNIFAKYTSSNPLIINENEYIYVDGEKIYQDIKKNEKYIAKNTFKNYITTAKKELKTQKLI